MANWLIKIEINTSDTATIHDLLTMNIGFSADNKLGDVIHLSSMRVVGVSIEKDFLDAVQPTNIKKLALEEVLIEIDGKGF